MRTETSAQPPAFGYMLCASPRSGSTLLCDLLTQASTAGAPGSYFRPASIRSNAERWGCEVNGIEWDRSYLDAARTTGRASTGCFAMRIMWGDMPAFLRRLTIAVPDCATDRERLDSAFGVRRYVHLSRHDKVAQAVSLVVAELSGVWHRNADGSVRQAGEPTAPVNYDYDRIASRVDMLRSEEHGWNQWFADQAITPLRLTYEELRVDPIAQTHAILGYLGRQSLAHIEVATSPMAQSLSHEWIRRFNADTA